MRSRLRHDQTRAFEHLEVLVIAGRADRKGMSEFFHRCLSLGETSQYRATRGVGGAPRMYTEMVRCHIYHG